MSVNPRRIKEKNEMKIAIKSKRIPQIQSSVARDIYLKRLNYKSQKFEGFMLSLHPDLSSSNLKWLRLFLSLIEYSKTAQGSSRLAEKSPLWLMMHSKHA